MSEQNNNSENTDPDPTPPPPKPKLSNIELHNLKKKLKVEVEEENKEKEKAEETDAFLLEAIDARKINAPQYVLALIENLDPQSQLEVLKAHAKKNVDPNMTSIGVPIGGVKDPLEEYMTYNQSKDKIEYNIPASVLMNSKNNKKLLGVE